MIYLLMLVSIIAGTVGLAIPIIYLNIRSKKKKDYTPYCFCSSTLCLIAIIAQYTYTYFLIKNKDYPALADTVGTSLMFCLLLSFAALILNLWIIIFVKYKDRSI